MNRLWIVFLIAGLTSSVSFAQTPSATEQDHERHSSAYTHNSQSDNHDEQSMHDESESEARHSPEEHGHEDHDNEDQKAHEGDGEGHVEGASATLTSTQMAMANIQVVALTEKRVDYQLYAPGEILSNGYTSYQVSPRIASMVLKRHVTLGNHVKQGQPLVTLFSEIMAQAQANYRTVWPEWQRVQSLGRKTVGEQRFTTTKAQLEAAQATLFAYGLTEADLTALKRQQANALGEYTLRAAIDGTVLTDDFEQGQRVEAGSRLIKLADEKQLWVEARLPANLLLNFNTKTPVEVVTGNVRVQATVVQEAHTIDPVTRTRTVRLLVNNQKHQLHPYQFADVYFRFQTEKPVLAVPENALMRGADGDWVVFVEDHPREFMPVEVELGRALGRLREITGIPSDTRIVIDGAFFVASEIAKGGFDPHNH